MTWRSVCPPNGLQPRLHVIMFPSQWTIYQRGVLHSCVLGEKRGRLRFIQITCRMCWQRALMSFKTPYEICSQPITTRQISDITDNTLNKHIIICVSICEFKLTLGWIVIWISHGSPWQDTEHHYKDLLKRSSHKQIKVNLEHDQRGLHTHSFTGWTRHLFGIGIFSTLDDEKE